MAFLTCLAFLAIGVNGMLGQHHHNSSAHTSHSHGQVDIAITNLGMHYDSILCRDIVLVNCETYVTHSNEQVCGSDGVTYPNHCKFTHAKCRLVNLHSNHELNLVNHGPCMYPTTPPVTMDPLMRVFCQSMDSINCGTDIDILCGSDGQLYVNRCEFSKSTCDKPALTVADRSSCT